MTNYFITFGSSEKYSTPQGDCDFIAACERLTDQVNMLNLFDKTITYTDIDLYNDKEFWEKNGNFIEINKRGYGYWLWKPYIIKKTMDMMKDGDILLYLDSGCEINILKHNLPYRDNFSTFIEYVKNDLIIDTNTYQLERSWCKMDLIQKLDMFDARYLNTDQRQAGAVLYYVCDKTRKFVNDWYEIGCDHHMIDDSPSTSKNLDEFIEHRHDQSIFSLLFKKYGFENNHSLFDCIRYDKNRNGHSRVKYSDKSLIKFFLS